MENSTYRGLSINNNTSNNTLNAVLDMGIVQEELYANKNTSFNDTGFTTRVTSKVKDNKILFNTELEYGQYVLNDVRKGDTNLGKITNKIIFNLLKILTLVEDGKIFDINIHPLNFIYEDDDDTGNIKAFVRKNVSLERVTNEWIFEVQKLIAFYLSPDSLFKVEDYGKLELDIIVKALDEDTAESYIELIKEPTVKDMFKVIALGEYEDEDDALEEIATIEHFPKFNVNFKQPINEVTSSASGMDSHSYVENETDYDFIEDDEDSNYNSYENYGNYDDDEYGEDNNLSKKERRKLSKKNNLNSEYKSGMPIKKGASNFVVLLILILGFAGGFSLDKFVLNKKEEPTAESNKDMYNGLLNASVQNYSQATSNFDKFLSDNKLKLSEDETNAIFYSYILNGNYDKAITFDPSDDAIEIVINFLRSKDEDGSDKTLQKELNNITSNADPLEMERAIRDEDYDKIVSLKDKVKVTGIQLREKAVAEALVKSGKEDDAIELAKKSDNSDLLGAVKSWKYDMIDKGEGTKEQKDKEKRDFDKKLGGD